MVIDMLFLASLCDNKDIKNIFMVIVNIIKLFCFFAPILASVFITIDFGKIVIGNPDDARKEISLVIKRLIYCVVVFLVPFIVSFVLNIVRDSGIPVSSCFTYDKAKNNVEEKNG